MLLLVNKLDSQQ